MGYTTLAHNPEIVAAVDTIARLIGSMTIHLMENSDDGDIRIKDELAKKVDVNPNQYMTRSNFVHWIVKNLFLEGGGNVVVWPKTRRGVLRELVPVPPSLVSFGADGWGYKVIADGKEYAPDEVLHFALNPGSYSPMEGRRGPGVAGRCGEQPQTGSDHRERLHAVKVETVSDRKG